ncbi:MAG TPA: ATP-binding cassette domain-containing protein [Candidatus Binatia bacterium]|nr:ATP-binding cassette domain-containing protein [Candidatus Binatia bacterium]
MKKIPALELRDVSYTAGGKTILQSIDWTVQRGEHWAILGPNGSGKTTLLRLACGYLWPNRGGEIYRKGKQLTNLPELRKSIGWVTSTLTADIPPFEKVIRTVISGKFAQIGYLERFGGEATAADYRLAASYLRQLGCDDLHDQEFGSLSQGEQQKVLIARARMTRPYLMIFDEPCAGMDPGARENFLQSLTRLGKQRTPSLIYVTHHVEEILPLFKRVLVLRDGRVLSSGAARDVLRPDVLERIYGIPLTLEKRRGRYWPVPKR